MKLFLKNNQNGFTVTEMVVVLAVIAILTVIALKTFGQVKERAKNASVRNNINTIDSALKKFSMKHQGHFPGFTRWPVADMQPRYLGTRIIGGNSGPRDSDYPRNQDDYLDDTKDPSSLFRRVLPSRYSNFPNAMKGPDALYAEGLLTPYPNNPFKTPGTGMVNVAYLLASYDKGLNQFSLLPIEHPDWSEPTIGLAPGSPDSDNLPYVYSIHGYMWRYSTENRTLVNNYPSGDFAYIPLGLATPTGEYATSYWLIGYGDVNTLKNSPYNDLLRNNPNFPNFPRPLGDGNPTTPPRPGTYEYMVRQMCRGALVITGTAYEDQLSISRN